MQSVGWHIEVEFTEDESHTTAASLVRLPDGTEAVDNAGLVRAAARLIDERLRGGGRRGPS